MSQRAETASEGGRGPQGERGGSVLQGTIERVTYHDPGTRYTVLRIRPERGYADPELLGEPASTPLTAVGRASSPAAGTRVRLLGGWTLHRTHGRQFAFEAMASLPPLDPRGLERYLASAAFEGIGKVLARRIVETLGTNALEIARKDPSRLDAVAGLRPAVRDRLVARLRADLGEREVLAFLFGLELGTGQAESVLRIYGSQTEVRILEDPYRLARDVAGIGFHTADRVAAKLGTEPSGLARRRAALLHALEEEAGAGHCLALEDELCRSASEALRGEVPPESFPEALEDLRRAGDVILQDPPAGEEPRRVYLAMFHASETRLVDNLGALLASDPAKPLADAAALSRLEQGLEIALHAHQREAVLGLLRHRLALLTGGPGVGKTSIVRLVVALAERARARVLLASPTGRAAKRLAEATGREAKTIHRLLGYDPFGRRFRHDGATPLEADLVIVDEISMLDLVLAHHLVKAVQPPTRLLLIGDPNQLPSVGPGNVLADLIASERIPVFRLTQIFRQDERSLIVRNAHGILSGEDLEFAARDDPGGDFYFFPADDQETAAERLVEVVTERIPRRFDMDWIEDVQVLAPMYRGACGVDALNLRLREALCVGGHELRDRGRTWRTGDRVIHTRNDYEKEVFNGDMGRIVRIDPDGGGLTVRYPERQVGYARGELADLQPAFAITVHRSQGGEFPAVVMPLVTNHYMMLKRHLLYTAVTRARRLVVLIGSRKALGLALDDGDQSERRSGLAERLRRTLVGGVGGPATGRSCRSGDPSA